MARAKARVRGVSVEEESGVEAEGGGRFLGYAVQVVSAKGYE